MIKNTIKYTDIPSLYRSSKVCKYCTYQVFVITYIINCVYDITSPVCSDSSVSRAIS